MDISIIETMISSLGFPIVMVGACGFFIWKMYHAQLMDKEKLYAELRKLIEVNRKFARIINAYTQKIDIVQEDIEEIKDNIREAQDVIKKLMNKQ